MMRALRHLAVMAACSAALCAAAPAGAFAEGLQPYQMIRSLQLVQDRIAGGDHAALPMQRKLLEMADTRLRGARDEDFEDRRNQRALLVYAMSGGNPTTLEILLPRIGLEDGADALARAVGHYLNGNAIEARRAFSRIVPARQHEEVVASAALLKGSVLAREEPARALREFDLARLSAPGTLVEEAALRRSLALAVELDDVERFMSAAGQYARRFLRSPYAAQFAEAFVAGIVAFSERVDTGRVDEIVSWMNEEQARTVYLRLARLGAIDGHTRLLDYASARASAVDEQAHRTDDARSRLYAAISSITSQNVDEVLRSLETLETSGLSQQDRDLLGAARRVAREVLAPAPGTAAPLRAPVPEPETTLPVEAAAPPDALDTLVTSSRSRLEEIDDLLGRTER